MTVEEMLRRISSAELGEWQAFEYAFGPLGRDYQDVVLRNILQKLDRLVYVTEAVHTSAEDADELVIPQEYPIPSDLFLDRGNRDDAERDYDEDSAVEY